MQTYTIRKLEWEYDASDELWRASTVPDDEDYRVFSLPGTDWWTLRGPGRHPIKYKSDDAAKLAAEAHWQERIRQALLPVTEQNKENA